MPPDAQEQRGPSSLAACASVSLIVCGVVEKPSVGRYRIDFTRHLFTKLSPTVVMSMLGLIAPYLSLVSAVEQTFQSKVRNTQDASLIRLGIKMALRLCHHLSFCSSLMIKMQQKQLTGKRVYFSSWVQAPDADVREATVAKA